MKSDSEEEEEGDEEEREKRVEEETMGNEETPAALPEFLKQPGTVSLFYIWVLSSCVVVLAI